MKIIIVENELYLAQSIQNNLSEKLNAKCEIFASYDEAIETDGDVYIVNTNLKGNIEKLIDAKKENIIILLAPYVTYTSVTQPIQMGADDYLQKPFSIEELIRKIVHLREYYSLKKRTMKMENFIEHILEDIELDDTYDLKFPLFIKTNYPKAVDKIIFDYAKENMCDIKLIDIQNLNVKELKNKDTIYYAKKFYDNPEIINTLSKYNSVIVVPKDFENSYPHFNMLEIEISKKSFLNDEILSIEDYIKFIILNHQHKLPDTELSKRLGISRKSLWEKRKKYGIFKQK
ncbi:response regulator [Nautilia sp. PV-1]|uniref:response regulator n=1 Tax=Nautilia sp. PV-1 TaxID=2579250 RepID=UPI000FD895F7|nr:response regulator [Nautilia sp. PV-1]AZV46038.1 response regulator [Nautilia sp. PV-1]